MKIRTLIIDDEVNSRKLIRRLLASNGLFEIAGECADGRSAVELIRATAPDLILLDVQMPELTGFEVLQQIASDRMPVVIFITAYDKFALDAFEARALDYLLKPFEESRFFDALNRVATYFAGQRFNQAKDHLLHFVKSLPGPAKFLSRLMVKAHGAVRFLKVDDIDWMEATGNYITLHCAQEKFLIRGRLTELEKKLDPECFFRIHRSVLVNLDQVKEFKPLCKGEGTVVLKSGVSLSASRAGGQLLQQFLETAL